MRTELRCRDQILAMLKKNLLKAQGRMKQQYDMYHKDMHFEVADCVCLRLQSYKQTRIAFRKKVKLCPRFYGPYQVLQPVRQLAYKVDLALEWRIHLVFHVSYLKKKLRPNVHVVPTWPLINNVGEIQSEPERILARRMKKVSDRVVTEIVIKWRGC